MSIKKSNKKSNVESEVYEYGSKLYYKRTEVVRTEPETLDLRGSANLSLKSKVFRGAEPQYDFLAYERVAEAKRREARREQIRKAIRVAGLLPGSHKLFNLGNPMPVYLEDGTRVLVIPDQHVGGQHKRYKRAMFQFVKDFCPDVIIAIGDLGDFFGLGSYAKDPHARAPLASEFLQIRRFIDELMEISGAVHFFYIMGNHEDRLLRRLMDCPEFAGMVNYESRNVITNYHDLLGYGPKDPITFLYGTGARGGTNGGLRVNDCVTFRHGHLISGKPGLSAFKDAEQNGESITHGHVHRAAMCAVDTEAGGRVSMEIGYGADLDSSVQHYARGGLTNWFKAISTAIVDDGTVMQELHEVAYLKKQDIYVITYGDTYYSEFGRFDAATFKRIPRYKRAVGARKVVMPKWLTRDHLQARAPKRRRVVFDFHGVVAEFNQAFHKFCCGYFDRREPFNETSFYGWGRDPQSLFTEDQVEEAFRAFCEATTGGIGDLQAIEGIRECMLKLEKAGIDIEIWTQVPGALTLDHETMRNFEFGLAELLTRELVREFNLPVPSGKVRFIDSSKKARLMVEEDVMFIVEDHPATAINVVAVEALACLLIDYKYNRMIKDGPGTNVLRIKNVKDIAPALISGMNWLEDNDMLF